MQQQTSVALIRPRAASRSSHHRLGTTIFNYFEPPLNNWLGRSELKITFSRMGCWRAVVDEDGHYCFAVPL